MRKVADRPPGILFTAARRILNDRQKGLVSRAYSLQSRFNTSANRDLDAFSILRHKFLTQLYEKVFSH